MGWYHRKCTVVSSVTSYVCITNYRKWFRLRRRAIYHSSGGHWTVGGLGDHRNSWKRRRANLMQHKFNAPKSFRVRGCEANYQSLRLRADDYRSLRRSGVGGLGGRRNPRRRQCAIVQQWSIDWITIKELDIVNSLHYINENGPWQILKNLMTISLSNWTDYNR